MEYWPTNDSDFNKGDTAMNIKLFILVGLFLLPSLSSGLEKKASQPADTVHQRTQQAVPYSLEETVQTFTKTAHGGVQHVVTKAPNNAKQVKAIQAYLPKMAEQFRKGDYSVTEKLHGTDMPGLAQLKRAKPDDIRFDYKALPNGGQIHYSSEYPQFVQALHEWFDAEAKDHNSPVLPAHDQHHATPAE